MRRFRYPFTGPGLRRSGAFAGFMIALALAASEPNPGEAKRPTESVAAKVQHLIDQLDDDQFLKARAGHQGTATARPVDHSPARGRVKRAPSAEVRKRLEQVLAWYAVRLEWYTDRVKFMSA